MTQIQSRERVVEQQDFGAQHERAGEAGAALPVAGHCAGRAVGPRAEFGEFEELLRFGGGVGVVRLR